MSNVITAKAKEVFLLMDLMFDKGKTVWIVVSGMSMFPFLREDLDRVELARTEFSKIKKGDIVLVQRLNGEFVLHRVYKKNYCNLYLVGDAQQWIEGPIFENQLKAVVVGIKRKNKVILSSNYFLKILVCLWIIVRPIRCKLLRIYTLLKKYIGKISSK